LKITVTLKTPDVIADAVKAAYSHLQNEWHQKSAGEEALDAIRKYSPDLEHVTIEFDTDKGGARVIKRA
jgi:hypothetical protein